MEDPTTLVTDRRRLPADHWRSLFGCCQVVLVLIGWSALLVSDDALANVRGLRALDWVIQGTLALHAVLCVAVVFRVRLAYWPCVVYTIVVIFLAAIPFFQKLMEGGLNLNVNLLLASLLLWRLLRTERSTPSKARVVGGTL
jgi:cell division protein FtsW (lipid II flippase)